MKHFIKEGDTYKMRSQNTYNFIVVACLLGVAFLGYYADLPALMWVMLVLVVLLVLSIRSKYLVIDLNKHEIRSKAALVQSAVTIPINKIDRFELHVVSHNFVQTNTALNGYYWEGEKEKLLLIAQGFTKSAMQRILNELEEILENDSTYR